MSRCRWFLLFLGLVLAGGMLVAFGASRMGAWAVQFLERQIPGQPAIKSWSVRFTPGVVLIARGVEIAGPPASASSFSLKAAQIEFGLDSLSLLFGRLRLKQIVVDAPELTVAGEDRRHGELESRARHPAPRGSPGASLPRVLAVDPLPIEVREGRVVVRGEGIGTIGGLTGRFVYSQRGNWVEYRLDWEAPRGGRIHLRGSLALGTDPVRVAARVESSSGAVAGQATLEGHVRGPLLSPRLTGRITGRGKVAVLPSVWLSLAGSGSGDFAIESLSGTRRIAGMFTLEDGRLELPGYAPVEALRGRIIWTPRTAEFPGLTGRWGSAQVSARFKVAWSPSRPTLRGDLSLSPIDPAPLFRRIAEALRREPAPPSRAARLVPPAHAAPREAAVPDWLRQLGVDLRLRVASLHLNGEPLGALYAQLVAADGLWHLQGVRLTLEEGEPRGYVRLDLRPSRPRGTLFARGPGLALLRDGLPEPYRLVGGEVMFETLLSWEGLTWREVRESLRGQGSLRIRDGLVPTAGLKGHVEVRGLPGAAWEARPLLTFDELSARYRVTGPQVVTHSLVVSGLAWEIRGEGAVDLSGRFDFRFTGYAPRIQRLRALLQGDLARPRLILSP